MTPEQPKFLRSIVSFASLAVLLIAMPMWAATARVWLDYTNAKYGFSLRVPTEHFIEGQSRNPEAGMVWISRDRRARLIAVAGANETGGTLESYRQFVMENAYAGARFEHAPVGDNWFVLSGVKGDQIFYERVTFVCGGRFIYGWQLFYPASQRRIYDPVVEEIHRSYRIGGGDGGPCDR